MSGRARADRLIWGDVSWTTRHGIGSWSVRRTDSRRLTAADGAAADLFLAIRESIGAAEWRKLLARVEVRAAREETR